MGKLSFDPELDTTEAILTRSHYFKRGDFEEHFLPADSESCPADSQQIRGSIPTFSALAILS